MDKRTVKSQLPGELQEKLQFLRRKWPVGTRVESHLDAADVLNQIGLSVERTALDLTATQARRIHAQIYRWHTKHASREGHCTRYSESSIESVSKILLSVTRTYLSSLSGESVDRRGKDFRRLTRFVNGCVSTLVSFCDSAERPSSWRHSLLYVHSVCKVADTDFGEFFSVRNLGENFNVIQNGILHALEFVLEEGRVDEADRMLAALGGHHILQQRASDELAKILQEKAARLPFASQTWIMASLRLTKDESEVQYASPAESPEVRQAAGILLFLWDHAKEGGPMREALERFQVLCEKHFCLFLRGEVGTTAEYDSRIHESPEAVSGRVTLLRPWVEWFSPPRAHIVIRALVAPARQ